MAGDGTGMKEYIQENSEMFRHIPPDTYDMLKALLHADRWWKADADSGKGEILLLIKLACRKLEKGKARRKRQRSWKKAWKQSGRFIRRQRNLRRIMTMFRYITD